MVEDKKLEDRFDSDEITAPLTEYKPVDFIPIIGDITWINRLLKPSFRYKTGSVSQLGNKETFELLSYAIYQGLASTGVIAAAYYGIPFLIKKI